MPLSGTAVLHHHHRQRPRRLSAALAHPNTRSQSSSTRSPITLRSEPSMIIAAISGAATTPLITADQNSACIGSTGENTIAAPTRVAPAIAP
jgi:hypothetical protein